MAKNGNNKSLQCTGLNDFLSCSICKGYMIDATTITECLHSFCKTCIVNYLKTKSDCPKCQTVIHKTKPLLNIRSDPTLQDIIYKIVPGLFRDEMQRRSKFYEDKPEAAKLVATGEERGEISGQRIIYSSEDYFSLSIEYLPQEINYTYLPLNSSNPVTRSKSEVIETVTSKNDNYLKRYLKCQGGCRVYHLKKLLRNKYELKYNHDVEMFYKCDPLSDEYSIMDLAYIYMWKKNGPLPLYYKISDLRKCVKRKPTPIKDPVLSPPKVQNKGIQRAGPPRVPVGTVRNRPCPGRHGSHLKALAPKTPSGVTAPAIVTTPAITLPSVTTPANTLPTVTTPMTGSSTPLVDVDIGVGSQTTRRPGGAVDVGVGILPGTLGRPIQRKKTAPRPTTSTTTNTTTTKATARPTTTTTTPQTTTDKVISKISLPDLSITKTVDKFGHHHKHKVLTGPLGTFAIDTRSAIPSARQTKNNRVQVDPSTIDPYSVYPYSVYPYIYPLAAPPLRPRPTLASITTESSTVGETEAEQTSAPETTKPPTTLGSGTHRVPGADSSGPGSDGPDTSGPGCGSAGSNGTGGPGSGAIDVEVNVPPTRRTTSTTTEQPQGSNSATNRSNTRYPGINIKKTVGSSGPFGLAKKDVTIEVDNGHGLSKQEKLESSLGSSLPPFPFGDYPLPTAVPKSPLPPPAHPEEIKVAAASPIMAVVPPPKSLPSIEVRPIITEEKNREWTHVNGRTDKELEKPLPLLTKTSERSNGLYKEQKLLDFIETTSKLINKSNSGN